VKLSTKFHDSTILYHSKFHRRVILFDNIDIIVCIVHRYIETSRYHHLINPSSSSHHTYHFVCSTSRTSTSSRNRHHPWSCEEVTCFWQI